MIKVIKNNKVVTYNFVIDDKTREELKWLGSKYSSANYISHSIYNVVTEKEIWPYGINMYSYDILSKGNTILSIIRSNLSFDIKLNILEEMFPDYLHTIELLDKIQLVQDGPSKSVSELEDNVKGIYLTTDKEICERLNYTKEDIANIIKLAKQSESELYFGKRNTSVFNFLMKYSYAYLMSKKPKGEKVKTKK